MTLKAFINQFFPAAVPQWGEDQTRLAYALTDRARGTSFEIPELARGRGNTFLKMKACLWAVAEEGHAVAELMCRNREHARVLCQVAMRDISELYAADPLKYEGVSVCTAGSALVYRNVTRILTLVDT